MPDYEVGKPEPLVIDADPALSGMYALSPYVWTEGGRWRLALRAVPRSDRAEEKVSRVHLGTSDDGLRFAMDDEPFLAPGPGADDRDGCEDPTVVLSDGYVVFYSGYNQQRGEGQLLWAASDDLRRLTKRGRVLPRPQDYENAKEATVLQAADGTWRLYFEYASDGRSVIGAAEAPALGGPWTPCPPPIGRGRATGTTTTSAPARSSEPAPTPPCSSTTARTATPNGASAGRNSMPIAGVWSPAATPRFSPHPGRR